jgi:branched-chain amino acid transport system ATP-binding protein
MGVAMLKAVNITKRFGALKAVDNLSFEVQKGQIYGIAGPNGAGKSTIYNIITGFYPFEGHVEFCGRAIKGLRPHKIARLGIARTFQIPQVFESLTVEKSVSIGSRFGDTGPFDPAYVDHVISFLDLGSQRTRNTAELNLLGKKKLMIGAALATKPKMLMLDEPMAGLNALEIKAMMDLIRKINSDLEITIVIIEHFMKVLTDLTEILLIIETGRMICCDAPEIAANNPQVIESYLGDAYVEG